MLTADIVGFGFLVFLALMLLKVPIAISLGLGGIFSMFLGMIPADIVPQRIFVALDSFTMLAIPLFIFVGQSMNAGGITDKLYGFANRLVGRVRGGLAHVNIIGSVIFAGMSGSAVADASGIGQVEIKAMTDEGYDVAFAAATTAASATVGPIIPPSIPFVVYGSIAEVSIGRLFLGGFLPGTVIAILMMIYVAIVAKKRNFPRMEKMNLRLLWKSFLEALPALLAPVLLIGGISFGIFSPTEGAAVTAVYSVVIGVFCYRALTFKDFVENLKVTARASSVILLIIGVANIFTWLVAVAQIPQMVSAVLLSITQNKIVILALINVVLLIAGCFMETNAIMLVGLPILLPIIKQIGVDPVHFGIVMTLNLMIGLLTPPVGLTLFVCCNAAKISMGRLMKEVIPYYIPLFISLLLITYIPEITMWLPNLIMGK